MTYRAARKRDPQALFQVIIRTPLDRVMSDARKAVEARNTPAAPVA